jgi:hypothetical protein
VTIAQEGKVQQHNSSGRQVRFFALTIAVMPYAFVLQPIQPMAVKTRISICLVSTKIDQQSKIGWPSYSRAQVARTKLNRRGQKSGRKGARAGGVHAGKETKVLHIKRFFVVIICGVIQTYIPSLSDGGNACRASTVQQQRGCEKSQQHQTAISRRYVAYVFA